MAHHHNRAVGVPHNRVGDTPHERPPQGSKAAAPYNYQSGAQPPGQPHDLRVRVAQPWMDSRYLTTRLPYFLRLLLEFSLGRLLDIFFHPALQIWVENDGLRIFIEDSRY